MAMVGMTPPAENRAGQSGAVESYARATLRALRRWRQYPFLRRRLEAVEAWKLHGRRFEVFEDRN